MTIPMAPDSWIPGFRSLEGLLHYCWISLFGLDRLDLLYLAMDELALQNKMCLS